ncbi:hypothetical protein [Lentilactobacillus hilgardii]|uniref:hypothetical protein n=1 Tax=Lentilactobacillus hilgardii TaxID=1588 RepID=UPI0021C2FA12|nr:hypothetical protein [Lentilactobacillus hilgardii]MCP9333146.1 hypothetical protein [Lentilactobacillus hilgardii]MCP9349757.1 hypothetical protein [Lentilactobacillus hilgardii]MCP9352685.1 hypothetical protein [Lentilactobacillus hilgardii]
MQLTKRLQFNLFQMPENSIFFWLTRIIMTGLGSWIALVLSQTISQSATFLIAVVILVQLSQRTKNHVNAHSPIYWLLVGLTAVAGTTLANILNIDFGISLNLTDLGTLLTADLPTLFTVIRHQFNTIGLK